MSSSEPDRVVALRPLGSPAALGLFGLAAASFTLAGLQLGWVPASEGDVVGLVLVGFAAPAQLLAAILAFLARDAGTGTALGVLSLTWVSAGLVLLTCEPGARSATLGLLLASSAVAVGLSGVTGLLTTISMGLVLITASVRLGLTSAFEISGQGWLQTLAGAVGIALALLAVAVAWASELEASGAPVRVPLGRRGPGVSRPHGSFSEQAHGLATEPGVRTLL